MGGKMAVKGLELGMNVVLGNRKISGWQEPSALGGRCICKYNLALGFEEMDIPTCLDFVMEKRFWEAV